MFKVGMFDFWRINERVTGSDKGEEEGEEDCDADGGAQRGPNGGDRELYPVSVPFSIVQRTATYCRTERIRNEVEESVRPGIRSSS